MASTRPAIGTGQDVMLDLLSANPGMHDFGGEIIPLAAADHKVGRAGSMVPPVCTSEY